MVVILKAPLVEYFFQKVSIFCLIASSKQPHQLGTKCFNIWGHREGILLSHEMYSLLKIAPEKSITLNVALLCKWTISYLQAFHKITRSVTNPAEIAMAPYSLVGTEDKFYFEAIVFKHNVYKFCSLLICLIDIMPFLFCISFPRLNSKMWTQSWNSKALIAPPMTF